MTQEPLTQLELRMLLYEVLFEKLQGSDGEGARAFVGLQGDKVVVMQPRGAHFAVLVLPAQVDAT